MSREPINQIPPELRQIEAALEKLAESERATAPASLEESLFAASRHRLHAGAEAIPIMRRMAPRRWSQLAIAAGVLIVAGLAALFAQKGSGTPQPVAGTPVVVATSLEEDVDLWLSLRTPDEFQNVADRIDLLSVDTESLHRSDPGELMELFDTDAM